MNYSRATIRVDGRVGATRDFLPNSAMEHDNIAAEATWEGKMPKSKKKFGPTTTGNRKGLIQPPRADTPSTASFTPPPPITKHLNKKTMIDAEVKSNLVL